MNKAFKVIWNHATQSWTAVSEIARAKGKTKSVKSAKTAIALAVATAGTMTSTQAMAATAATLSNDGQTVISGSGVPSGGSVPVNYQVYVETRPSNVNGGGSVMLGETATVADGMRNGVSIGTNTTINAAPATYGTDSAIGGVAIGDTVVSKSQSVAIGSNATSTGKMNVVIGNQVKSMGEQDVVIGNGAASNRENPDSYNIVIGRAANATVDASGAIAMGYEAKAGAGFASAIGRAATATGAESQAWGTNAVATKQGAIAIGRKSNADGLYSIAMGADLPGGGNTTAAAQSAIALGNGAQVTNASANSAIAIGQAAKSDYNSAIALGLYANATGGNYAMALGGQSTANGGASIAAGLRASANAERAIAIGREANASGNSSIAAGAGATATSAATNGIAYGTSAGVAAENAVAIGATAFANNAGAVALGNASTTRAATAENTATVGGVTYSGFAGNAPKSVVSVGSAGAERQLVNVAAGNISSTSTDAINGSQLYSVAAELGNQVFQSTYFHVNNASASQGAGDFATNLGNITDKAGARGQYSVTAGVEARALADYGIAIGKNANSTGSAVVIGVNASAAGLSDDPNTPNPEDVQQGAGGAVAIGEKATVEAPTGSASASIAIGSEAHAKGAKISDLTTRTGEVIGVGTATVIGANAKAIDAGVAIGQAADAGLSQYAIAVGVDARALGDRSTAVGVSTRATGQQAAAIGWNANASGVASLSIGTNSTSSGANSVAISGMSSASGAQSMALGYSANATGTNSIALGRQSGATGVQAAALTSYAKANGKDSIAAGVSATTTADALRGVAIARESSVSAVDGIAAGYQTKVSGTESIAIGKESNVTGIQSIAVGVGHVVAANNSGAFGDPNYIRAGADRSYTFGNNNTVTTADTFVLGSNVNRNADGTDNPLGTVANSVYLGNGTEVTAGTAVGTAVLNTDQVAGTTTTAGDKGTVTNATVANVTYGDFAGATANGAVSVGAAGAERRIQNVAAGEISKTSTDAINGSQLYMVAKQAAAPLTFTANTNVDTDAELLDQQYAAGDGTQQQLGEKIAIIGAATGTALTRNTDVVVSGDYSAKNIQTVVSNGEVQIQMAENPIFDSVQFGDTTGPKITNDGNNIKVGQADGSATKITNVANGTNPNDAVNLSQLNATKVTVLEGKNTNVTSAPNATTGGTDYTVNAVDTSASTSLDAASSKYLTVAANGTTEVGNATVTDYKVGLSAEAINKLDNAIIAVEDTATVNMTVTDGTLKADVISNDGAGTTVNTTAGGVSFDIKTDGTTVKVGDNNALTVVTGGTEAATNGTAKVSTGSNATDVATIGDLVDTINSVGWFTNSTNAGGNTTGTAADTKITAGKAVNFEAGTNLKVEQKVVDGNVTYTYSTADDVTFNNVTASNLTATGNTTVNNFTVQTGATINMGNNTVTNVANGTNPNDAVNLSQLNATKVTVLEGKNTNVTSAVNQTTGGTDYTVNAVDTSASASVDTASAKYLTVTPNGTNDVANATVTDYKVGLSAEAINKLDNAIIAVEDTATVNMTVTDGTLKADVISNDGAGTTVNTTAGGVSFDIKTDGTTVKVGDNNALTVVTGNTTVNTNGTVGVAPGSNATDVATIGDITKTINQGYWTTKVSGTDVDQVSFGDAVNFVNGTGTVARADGTNITFDVNLKSANNTITISNNTDGSVNLDVNTTALIQPITANTDGKAELSPVNGVTDSNKLVTAGDVVNTINNVSTFVTVDKDGGSIIGTATKSPVKAGDTVTFKAGAGTAVAQNGNNITYSVDFTNAATVDDTGNVAIDSTNGTKVINASDVVTLINNAGWNVEGSTTGTGTSTGTLETNLVTSGDTVTLRAGDNLNLDQEQNVFTFALQDDITVNNITTSNLTATGNTTVNNFEVAPNSVVNMGGNTITNVAPGTNGTDAVNLNQLNATKVTVQEGKNTNVTSAVNQTTGGTDYTINAVDTSASASVDAASAKYLTVAANGTTEVANATVTDYKVGLSTEAINKLDNAIIAVEDTATVNMTVTDGTLKADVISNDGAGTTVNTTAGGVSFDIKTDGTTVKVGDNNALTVVTGGTEAATNGTAKVSSGSNATDVATIGDLVETINNIGFNVTSGGNKAAGDDASSTLINPGEEITYSAGKNLTVKREGNNFTYATADDVTFNNITTNNFTVNPGGTVNMGGNTITNVAPGTNPTDAVNLSQLNASTAANAWKITGNNDAAAATTVGNQTVSFNNGAATTAVVDGTNVTYNVNADGKTTQITYTTATGATVYQVTDPVTGVVTYNTQQDGKGQTVDAQYVTGSQITAIVPTFNSTVFNSTVNSTTGAPEINIITGGTEAATNGTAKVSTGSNATDVATIGDLVDTINSVGWFTNSTNAGGNTTGTAADTKITAGKAVNFEAGTNLKVEQKVVDGNVTYTYSTADDVTFNNITASNLTVGPVTITNDGIDAGGTTITNVAPGTNGTDAVNLDQLNASTAANQWKITGNNDAAAATIVGNQTVSFNNGTGTTAVVDGTNVTYNIKTDGTTVNVGTDGNLTVVTGGLTNNADGNVTVPAGETGSSLVNQTTVANAINNSGWKLAADGTAGTELINPSETVTFIAGTNLEVTRDGANITYKTADDVTFNNITTSNLTANGNTTVNNFEVAPNSVVNMGGNTITNVAPGTNGTDAVNLDQLNASTAANQWKITGNNNATTATIVGNQTVSFNNGTGTTAVVDGTNVTYNINTDGTTVKVGDNGNLTVVTGNTTVTDGKAGVATDSKVSDVATIGDIVNTINNVSWNVFQDSTAQTDPTKRDAVTAGDNIVFKAGTNTTVNVSSNGKTTDITYDVDFSKIPTTELVVDAGKVQLPNTVEGAKFVNATNITNAINNSGWKTVLTNGNTEIINPGDTVNYVNGTGTAANVTKVGDVVNVAYDVKVDGTTIKVGQDGNLTVDVNSLPSTKLVNGNNTVVKGSGTTDDPYNVNVITGGTTVNSNGTVAIAGGANTTDVATIGDITKTINQGFWTTQVNGKNVDQVNFGDAVNFVNGTGTVARANGTNITFDVNLKSDDGSVVITNNTDGSLNLAVNVSSLPTTKLVNGNNTVVTGTGTTADPYKVNVEGDLTNITSIANGDTKITLGDNVVNVGGAQITGVANGTKPTDAVNLQQLNATKTEVKAGNNVNVTSATGSAGQTIYTVNAEKSTVTAADGSPITVNSTTNATTGVTNYELDVAVDGDTITIKDGKLVSVAGEANKVRETVVAGSTNVVVKDDKTNATGGKEFTVDLAKDITVNSVTANTVNVGPVTMTGGTAEDGTTELSVGTETSPSRITNVAPGVKGTDAVNVNQLQGAVTNINNRINGLEDDMEAGMAGSRAVAALPQVHRPGSSMLAVGLGSYGDKGAVAVGFSSLSDNGRLTFKANVDANTENKFGAGVGMGWEW